FHAALRAASPRWLSGGSPAALGPAPLILVHPSRSHVGDTLWLTPLLRAIHRSFPAAEVTVAGAPTLGRVLAGNPHVHRLLPYDPAGGGGGRRRGLDPLAGRPPRPPPSSPSAAARATAGSPRRWRSAGCRGGWTSSTSRRRATAPGAPPSSPTRAGASGGRWRRRGSSSTLWSRSS